MSKRIPEVGEFWEWDGQNRRFRIVYVCQNARHCCIEYERDGLAAWKIESLHEMATYLPWCKYFGDVEPQKPEIETVVFHEVACKGSGLYKELRWVDKVQSFHTPTGRTETRELPKR